MVARFPALALTLAVLTGCTSFTEETRPPSQGSRSEVSASVPLLDDQPTGKPASTEASPRSDANDPCTQLGPGDCYLGPSEFYPEQWKTSLEEALEKVAFGAKLPSHVNASADNVQAAYLSPGGLVFVMLFPLPSPPEQPIRLPHLEIIQSPWVGGDPEASLEEAIAQAPSVSKALYTVHGVTALGNKAHSPDDQTGENPAFLRLVLDGVEFQLGGGESLDLLIEIAETLS